MNASRIVTNIMPHFLAKFLAKKGEKNLDDKKIAIKLKNAQEINDYIKHAILSPKGCVILGNGPSLKESLRDDYVFISERNKMCVNDFVISDYFEQLKPEYYFFMDPDVCNPTLSQHMKDRLTTIYEALSQKVKWPIVVFLPESAKQWNYFMDLPVINGFIKLIYLNTAPLNLAVSKNKFELFRKNISMVPPHNVLVSCIFMAINFGYEEIYIMGADHSWIENLFVAPDNKLYWCDSHFYDTKDEKLVPIYKNGEESDTFTMGELMTGYAKLYNSYYELDEYAKSLNIQIFNMSKKSFIDAFTRK